MDDDKMCVLGKMVSRSDAIAIARRIIERAEGDRIEAAEKEANLHGVKLEREFAERIVNGIGCTEPIDPGKTYLYERRQELAHNGHPNATYEAKVQWVHRQIQNLRNEVGW